MSSTEQKPPEEILSEMLRLMGYDGLEVKLTDEGPRLRLDIEGEDQAEVIGKKGQTLDALQFLIGRMMNKQQTSGRSKPIVIDAGGYRQRRGQALQELAEKLREQVAQTGKAVAVNPMSAHDRRIIHMALKESPEVVTRSEGEGSYRRLLILPSDA